MHGLLCVKNVRYVHMYVLILHARVISKAFCAWPVRGNNVMCVHMYVCMGNIEGAKCHVYACIRVDHACTLQKFCA